MPRFLTGSKARTAKRKARHLERLAKRWAGHVPPIEIWRAGEKNVDTKLGSNTGVPDPVKSDSTHSNSN